MKYNVLSNGVEVSEVCLGTMTYGSQNTEEEGHQQLDYAWSRGVNFLDTAEMYPTTPCPETAGRTEEIVGTWLEKQPKRDKIVVATKVVGFWKDNWLPGNRYVPKREERVDARLSAEQIDAAVTASLRRLRTDYIDIYQLHWPDRYWPGFGSIGYDVAKERLDSIPFDVQVEAIGKEIKAGRIKAWGLSNETTFGVCRFIAACDRLNMPRPVTIQNSFCLVNRNFESELAEACAPSNFNIGLLPWSPLGGGVLSGKYRNGALPENSRFAIRPDYQPRYRRAEVHAAVEKYCAIADKAGITAAQLALAFCKSRWYAKSTIIGASKIEQLKEDIDAFEIELSDEVLKEIDAVHNSAMNPCNVAYL